MYICSFTGLGKEEKEVKSRTVKSLSQICSTEQHTIAIMSNNKKRGGRSGGRREESRETKISKALSYLLRHGAVDGNYYLIIFTI